MRLLISFACRSLSRLVFRSAPLQVFGMAHRTMDNISAEKNKVAILGTLQQYIQPDKNYDIFEVASGTGQHVVYFAEHFPNVHWYPSERDQECLKNIVSRVDAHGVKNVSSPVFVDASKPCGEWGAGTLQQGAYDFMTNVNMMHISPWEATVGLFRGAGVFLKESGALITYGPYMIDGTITPESNVRFDQALKQRCPDWGLRDTAELKKLAEANNLSFEKMHDMPVNNKILVFRKKSS